jgi:hypothetical protein
MSVVASSVVVRDERLQARFRERGFVAVELFGPEELEGLSAIYNRFSHHHGEGFSATILSPDLAYRREADAALRAIVAGPLARLVFDYRILACGFAVKSPGGGGGRMPLHQDVTLTDESGRPGISLWAPLVDVDTHNGCLQVVPGSQRWHRRLRAPGTPFVGAACEHELRASRLIDVPLRAGQGLILDHALFHASGPNGSPNPRPTLAVILIPSEQPARYCHRVVRDGTARIEHFEVADDFLQTHQIGRRPAAGKLLSSEPEPAASLTPEALAGMGEGD